MKRYSVKLGRGLVSLMALGTALALPAFGQTAGQDTSATQISFALAMAQMTAANTPVSTRQTASLGVPGPDGLVEGGAYVEADVLKSPDKDTMVATGHVELRYKGKIIRADEIDFNNKTGTTVARGHTQTIGEDGSVQFADLITYDDNMQSGVSENFAAVGKDNSKVFARRVVQLNPDVNQLTNVIYTPCQLCVKNSETQAPSWSIEAGKITQHKEKKMVYYNDATIKVRGVPIFFAPYLWTPDPELDRSSGFLTPLISSAKKRGGLSYEQPYLWSISPYTQLVVSPQFNASLAPLLNLDFKRNFYSGELNARFGFTNESFFDNEGERIGPLKTRDYLLADGKFKIDDNWRWSFTAQHVKDEYSRTQTYANFFERYNIDNAFEQAGDLTVDSRQLINQVNLTRQVPNAFFSVTMVNFESLQIGSFADPSTQFQPLAADSRVYPEIGPMIEAYWSPRSRILGGQLTLSANAIGLQHKLFPVDVIIPTNGNFDGLSGFDTARVSAGASWYGDMTTGYGLKWGPFFDLRHDYYHETDMTTLRTSANFTRDLGTVGVNLSYPLYRRFKAFSTVIEPVAQIAVSPKNQANPNLPNEDSQGIEFDDTTLFSVNKSPGFDVYESGARINLGLRSQVDFDSGMHFEGLIGRTLRDTTETQFQNSVKYGNVVYYYDPSGLAKQASDWIVDGTFDTGKGVYGFSRLRLDGHTLRVVQGESGATFLTPKTVATLRYVFNDVLVTPTLVNGKLVVFGNNYRDIQLYGQHFFTEHWGIGSRLDRDLIGGSWRRSTISLIYRDDCIQYELVYQRNDTALSSVNGKPSNAFFFRYSIPVFGKTATAHPADVR